MNEKVKLPKFVCDWLDQYKEELCGYPMTDVSKLNRARDPLDDASHWVFCKGIENQWKLIDALRYGYEAEPEPRWGIKAGKCYMDNIIEWSFDSIINTSVTLDKFDYFTDKTEADDMVKTFGFGEVVDLNKEDKVYD